VEAIRTFTFLDGVDTLNMEYQLYFYHKTLCVNAVYAGQCPSVYLYVCPVTLVYCIYSTEDVFKLLSRPSPGSPIIIVFFLNSSTGTQSQGEPPQPGRKIHAWVRKICDFFV